MKAQQVIHKYQNQLFSRTGCLHLALSYSRKNANCSFKTALCLAGKQGKVKEDHIN